MTGVDGGDGGAVAAAERAHHPLGRLAQFRLPSCSVLSTTTHDDHLLPQLPRCVVCSATCGPPLHSPGRLLNFLCAFLLQPSETVIDAVEASTGQRGGGGGGGSGAGNTVSPSGDVSSATNTDCDSESGLDDHNNNSNSNNPAAATDGDGSTLAPHDHPASSLPLPRVRRRRRSSSSSSSSTGHSRGANTPAPLPPPATVRLVARACVRQLELDPADANAFRTLFVAILPTRADDFAQVST